MSPISTSYLSDGLNVGMVGKVAKMTTALSAKSADHLIFILSISDTNELLFTDFVQFLEIKNGSKLSIFYKLITIFSNRKSMKILWDATL